MHQLRAAIIVGLIALLAVGPAMADEVTLTSPDGTVVISGDLIRYDGEFYRVDSTFGILTVDGSRVTCDGAGCPDVAGFVAEMTFSGARDVIDTLMPALVETFAGRQGFAVSRETPDALSYIYELRDRDEDRTVGRFTFRATSSSEGFADLLADVADIAISRREISDAERQLAREAGGDDPTAAGRVRVLALDAIVPLVSVANPVSAIPIDTLVGMFSGRITDWSTLGPIAAPVALHMRGEGAGIAEIFQQRIMNGETLAPGITRHDDNETLAEAVAADPFAIGLGAYSRQGDAVPLGLAGPCGLTSVATALSLKTEDFPLTAPVFLYTAARRLPRMARDFLDYVTAPAAQPVIRRAGFVDQFPATIPLDRQGLRFANAIGAAGAETTLRDLQRMVASLRGKVRLTPTFRFDGGRTTLDSVSRANVAALARALSRGVFDDRVLTFVGFSDADGTARINTALARRRAEAVRDAVRAAIRGDRPARTDLAVEAFGEAMPMACDDTDWGRSVNRRVEVWLE